MVCQPPSESKACVADELEQIASRKNVRINNTMAAYLTVDMCVSPANVYMQPAEYYIIIFKNLVFIVERLEYIPKYTDFTETIKKVLGYEKIAWYVHLKISRLQQMFLSPIADLDNSYTGFTEYDDKYTEDFSSKINNAACNVITKSIDIYDDYITYVDYAVKLKQHNAPVEDLKSEGALNQDEIRNAEMKVNDSQDNQYDQTVAHFPPGDGNRSPNHSSGLSSSWSPSSRSESTSSRSGSLSSRSGSPSSRSGSLSSRSGSPSSRDGSPSSNRRLLGSHCLLTSTKIRQTSTSGERTNCRNFSAEPSRDISFSQKPQSSRGTKDTTTENGNLLKSDLLVIVMTECESACEVDIALGQNCGSDLDIKADVKFSAHEFLSSVDILDLSDDQSSQKHPRKLAETVFDDPSMKNAFTNLYGKTHKDALSLETITDQISRTVTRGRRDYDLQALNWLSPSDKTDKFAIFLPAVVSQLNLDYSPTSFDDEIKRQKCLKNKECDEDLESSTIKDAVLLIAGLDDCAKREVGEVMGDKCTLVSYENVNGNLDDEWLGNNDGNCWTEYVNFCTKSEEEATQMECSFVVSRNEDCVINYDTSETNDVELLIEDVDDSKRTGVGENTYGKSCFSMYRHLDCCTENGSSETQDENCFSESPDDCKKSEENVHDKLYVCTYMNSDCDTVNESPDTFDVECFNKSNNNGNNNEARDAVEQDMTSKSTNNNNKARDAVEQVMTSISTNNNNEARDAVEQDMTSISTNNNNKARDAVEQDMTSISTNNNNDTRDAVEQDMTSISTNNNNNESLKDGKLCKQSAKNLRLKINDRKSKSVSQRTQQLRYLSKFDNTSSSLLCDNYSGEKCFIKIKSKAEVSKEAKHTSPGDCTCLYPHKCLSNKTVSRFSIMESLCPNLEGSFGLRLLTKFDPVRHMPWRYVIQTFDQPSSEVPSNLYIFMNFEVFRLSSFDFRKFPKDDSIFVTNLAKSGFYFESETVKIVCFGCRHTFQGSRDCSQSSTNSSHSSLCPRHVFNKPIDQWIQDLPLDALTDYFIYNGSLTPYLEETPSSVGQSSSNLTPKNVLETKPILDSPQTSAMSYSSGYQSEDILFVEPERETHSDVQLLVTDSSCTNLLQFEYPSSINHSYSLPSNLNYISGVVVCEERPEPNGSHSVLTSAAKQPLLYKSKSSHNAEGTNEVAEEGAVGGILPLNLDAAAYPHFSIEAVRRKSFTDWSPQHTHRPEDLAVAGFFYAGYSDCVRCFYCGLGLKYWRPADIPAYQHAKYRPRCSFNILYKGQDYIDRVQQELRSEQEATNIVETQTAPQQSLGREQTTLTAQAAVDPQESDYLSSEAAQEALANGWTRDQVGQAVSHIVRVYGESCLGIELLTDILIHFNTSDELNQGLPCNSPASSHASEMNSSVSQVTTSYPSSAQLVDALASGENGQERPEGNHRTQEEATLVRTPHSEQPEVRVPDFRDILTSVEREHSLLEERVTCRVCKSRPVSCIYLPCGHVIACQECAESATHCVFCRKVIIGTANVFLA